MAEEAATAASLQLTASEAVTDAKVSQLQSQSTLLEQMGRQQEAAEVQSTKLEGEAAELTRSLAETRAMLVRGIPLLVLLQRALGLSASLCLSIRDGRLAAVWAQVASEADLAMERGESDSPLCIHTHSNAPLWLQPLHIVSTGCGFNDDSVATAQAR